VLAEGFNNKWSFTESCNFSGTAEIKTSQDGTYICELKSNQVVSTLYVLNFKIKIFGKQTSGKPKSQKKFK
jgi:hypothetical protein